ncbi:MAG: thiamine pyrophosphate-dependent enzyme [bacterium]
MDFQKEAEKILDYKGEHEPTWCGGCGNYGIWIAIKRALSEMNIPPEKVYLCFDIGCNGNMNDKIDGYRFHGLHGRVLPAAVGAKLANNDLVVIATAGDGATYSEGMGHFIHTLRNEYPITFLVHDNQNYGLTTGQCSATTKQNIPMNSSPDGNSAKTLNPLDLALSLDPSFVAQGFSGDIESLKEIIKKAIQHQIDGKGLSYVNILQSCPTYNKATTQKWYFEKVKNMENLESKEINNLSFARNLVKDLETEIPLGVIYRSPSAVSFIDHIKKTDPITKDRATITEELIASLV